jgi:succinyl-diaminopimelate desuccinylase
MVDVNESLQQSMLELAQRLISINTVDPPGNERQTAECVASILRAEGIACDFHDIAPGRSNLVARVPGTKERGSLIYSAHFDTISVNRADWSVDPFGGEVRDGRLYGRGATDMKAALAAMVYSAIALKRAGRRLRGDLVLAFTAAENSSCLGARKLVDEDLLAGAEALLISEPTSLDVFVAEKGALWLRVSARGEYGHNAFAESRKGDRGNAIYRLSEYLIRVRDLVLQAPVHPYLGPPTVSVGLIRGGESTVLIPAHCSADIDIRMVPGLSVESVVAAFRGVAGEHIDVEVLDFKPPVTTAADHPFVVLCAQACEEVLGAVPKLTGVPYYTDGAIIAPRMNLPMVIIGPGEVGKSGSVDEYVEIDKLNRSLDIFTRVAERYLS